MIDEEFKRELLRSIFKDVEASEEGERSTEWLLQVTADLARIMGITGCDVSDVAAALALDASDYGTN